MSFFDGFVKATRTAFGFPPARSGDDRSQPREPAKRSDALAADAKTTFQRTPSTAAGSPKLPTLEERLRAAAPAPAAAAAAVVVPPHLARRGGGAPPTSSTPVAEQGRVQAAAAGTTARARITDASTGQLLGDVARLAGTGAAATAARNVQRGIDYYARTFGRNGLDGAGAGVDVLINDRSTDAHGVERFAGNGGYYATPQRDGSVREAIHFGTGTAYDAARGRVNQHEMLYADDLAIHELTHGIIRKETGHLGGGADEAGATNEAIADVMAAAATRDWRIGEGMYASDSDYRLMRNIARPDDPAAVHGLWTSMDEIRSRQRAGTEVEEHWASGVLSTAAWRIQQRFGGEAGWNVVERVFYDAIDDRRLGDMSFVQVAAGLRRSAEAAYGQGSSAARVVDEELRRAGL